MNAKVCDRHFSESCFTSTLRERLIKFACPQITENPPSTASDALSALSSPRSHCTFVEVSGTEPSHSNNLISSPTTSSHAHQLSSAGNPQNKKNQSFAFMCFVIK
ncbi:hypothetical protein AVEN_80146-1 [Araneus ventricosus]|uniref:THAP-type domain-containing protein n=1 Tax=Araneus ventricosus TaxID=182803 RepID=A0A4Y2HD29_ARAVE|nr:hypothetical protein AVEN_80146-1 [Araneus ventricosus]